MAFDPIAGAVEQAEQSGSASTTPGTTVDAPQTPQTLAPPEAQGTSQVPGTVPGGTVAPMPAPGSAAGVPYPALVVYPPMMCCGCGCGGSGNGSGTGGAGSPVSTGVSGPVSSVGSMLGAATGSGSTPGQSSGGGGGGGSNIVGDILTGVAAFLGL